MLSNLKPDQILIKKHFEELSFIKSDIESYNYFIDQELQNIIAENGDIEPTVIPQNVDEFKIRFDKPVVGYPEITEADGSKRKIYPAEARLRKLTYYAPISIRVSAIINGAQRESFETQICNIPVMLRSKQCHLYKLSPDELISH
ncbi:MAG: hypothetical protein EPN86_06515, partial [Nanoarchaeota archaeon]